MPLFCKYFSHLDISDNSVLSHINSSEMNHSIITFNWKQKRIWKVGKKGKRQCFMRYWTTAAVTFELCCLKSQFYDKRWFLIRHISLLNKPKLMVGLSWKICRLSNLCSLIKIACGNISAKYIALFFAHFYVQQKIFNLAKFYYIGVCTNCGNLEIKCLLVALRKLMLYCLWNEHKPNRMY